jgi:lysozyme
MMAKSQRNRGKRFKPLPLIPAALIITGLFLVLLQFDYPFPWRYPVRGIDISRHQGTINWKKLGASGKVDFVYIKATEGGDYVDPLYRENWRAAKNSGIARGAYHFYSLHTPGVPQAEHFLRVVKPERGGLPLAVDLEFEPGNKRPPEKKRFLAELAAFDKKVSMMRGYSPVYYLNEDFYRYYFTDRPVKNRLWIRGIYHKPAIMKKTGWLIWQYSDFGRVEGIGERVDLDVLNGSRREFVRLLEAGNNYQLKMKRKNGSEGF